MSAIKAGHRQRKKKSQSNSVQVVVVGGGGRKRGGVIMQTSIGSLHYSAGVLEFTGRLFFFIGTSGFKGATGSFLVKSSSCRFS